MAKVYEREQCFLQSPLSCIHQDAMLIPKGELIIFCIQNDGLPGLDEKIKPRCPQDVRGRIKITIEELGQ